MYFWRKTPEMTNNEISIEQINKLDAAAFRLLYNNYYKALVCYAITIVGDSESAEDIVQELFSTIWEKKMFFRSLASFRVYLYNSVRNASLDYLKHKDVEGNYLQKMLDSQSIASFFRQLMRCRIDAGKFFDVYGRQEERGDCHCTPCFS